MKIFKQIPEWGEIKSLTKRKGLSSDYSKNGVLSDFITYYIFVGMGLEISFTKYYARKTNN